MKTGMGILIFFVALMAIGVTSFLVKEMFMPEVTPSTTIVPQSIQTQSGTETVTALVKCSSDYNADGQLRVENTLAATTTYVTPTCYFMPKSVDMVRITAGSLSSSDYSTAVNLPCSPAGNKFQPICVTTQGSIASTVGTEFTVAGDTVKQSLTTKAVDGLQVKVEDKYAGGAQFFNMTEISNSAVGSLTWQYFNGSGTTGALVRDGPGGASLTIDADEYIDARIYLKTNSTKTQFGEDGLRVWMLVDAASNKWQEPIAARGTDPVLVNKLSQMADKDREYYSGYEYAYEIGSIGDREIYIDYYQQTASGVNPGSSDQPKIAFCAEGRYNSNKLKDTVLVGCWTDATTQTQVEVAEAQIFQFNVA